MKESVVNIKDVIYQRSGPGMSASLLAHERSRFAICQWEFSSQTP